MSSFSYGKMLLISIAQQKSLISSHYAGQKQNHLFMQVCTSCKRYCSPSSAVASCLRCSAIYRDGTQQPYSNTLTSQAMHIWVNVEETSSASTLSSEVYGSLSSLSSCRRGISTSILKSSMSDTGQSYDYKRRHVY